MNDTNQTFKGKRYSCPCALTENQTMTQIRHL